MATIKFKEFPRVGQGFTVHTQMIPPAGLVTVLRAARSDQQSLFRYSRDGGETYTEWITLTKETFSELGRLTDSCDLVLDYVTKPYVKTRALLTHTLTHYQLPFTIRRFLRRSLTVTTHRF